MVDNRYSTDLPDLLELSYDVNDGSGYHAASAAPQILSYAKIVVRMYAKTHLIFAFFNFPL
jgi:hypothetical protein